MAAPNFMPEFTVCKTESDAFTGMIENRELVRKNSTRRLHGNQTRPVQRLFTPAQKRRKQAPPAVNSMPG